jgi:phage N-6-adenine-methyltransferase
MSAPGRRPLSSRRPVANPAPPRAAGFNPLAHSAMGRCETGRQDVTTTIERLTQAEQMLADIATAGDAVDVIAFAEAARVWAQQAKLGTSAVNHATVIKMRAERRLADAVDEGQKEGAIAKQGQPKKPSPSEGYSPPPTLEEIGISNPRVISEARKIRDNYTDDDLVDLERQANEADELLSRKELVTRPRGKLISQAGGSEHWYTPLPHIESARLVLGAIDLDPASSDIANRTVRAGRYYTIEDDGLAQDWAGRIWMNPPYGEPAGRFVAKLASHLDDGSVSAAIVLVSLHAMSTSWFDPLFGGVLCVSSGRLKFTDEEGRPGSPTFGSVFAYFGPHQDRFAQEFGQFGHVLTEWR